MNKSQTEYLPCSWVRKSFSNKPFTADYTEPAEDRPNRSTKADEVIIAISDTQSQKYFGQAYNLPLTKLLKKNDICKFS